MKSLSLSQAVSILAIAMMASLIPACGGGNSGSSSKLSASQTAPTEPTIHESFSAPIIVVPGSAVVTTMDVKTWTFTPAPGEVVTQVSVSGQYMVVPTGGTPSIVSTMRVAGNISLLGPSFDASSTYPMASDTGGQLLDFYINFRPSFNYQAQAQYNFPLCPMAFTLKTNYDDWSGNFRNLRIQIFTMPFTTVVNSPSIQ